MQGFIITMTKVRNQDLILKILTPSKICTAYRFYGARHSILALGKKIDFEIQPQTFFLPKLRNVLELGHSWEGEYERLYVWQCFIKLLASHLRDVEELEPFYFELLESGARKNKRQNPIRVALEMGAELLRHEGRTARAYHNRCFVCEEELGEKVGLGRAFLLAHPHCVAGGAVEKQKILEFLGGAVSVELEDAELDLLWGVLSLGL